MEQLVRALLKPPAQILAELSPAKCNLIHLALGISGEAGEILDTIKKHTIYNKPLDVENLIEELGDMEFFLEALRQELNVSRDTIIAANKAKLSKRYNKGSYSNEQAIARADKVED